MGPPQQLAGRTGSYIGPVATAAGGAALGSFLGPVGAQIGGSVGWLLGSWLFGAKPRDDQQVLDPGAEEMPRPNQALRGTTMPVGFGTNRWPSNIVWMKNWTVIRHESRESAGGGKGGGSGMGGKGGARGQTNVNYEYKIDLLMHCGMTPEPVNLFGGWLGSERLNGNTIGAIAGTLETTQVLFQSAVQRARNAALSFTDAFFGTAGPSNDDNFENWDFFEQQEGFPCRWPHTTYIGFQQLNLGGSAALPQINWEIGPGAAEITFNSAYQGSSSTVATNEGPFGQSVVTTATGVQFAVMSRDNTTRIVRVSDGAVFTPLSDAQFNTDADALGLDPGSIYTFGITDAFAVQNTPYMIVWGVGGVVVGTQNWCFIAYRINDDGTVTRLGGYQGRTNFTYSPQIMVAGLGGNSTESDPIYVIHSAFVGGTPSPQRLVLPSLSAMISTGTLEDDGTNPMNLRIASLSATLGNFFGDHQSKYTYQQFGFILPAALVGPLSVTYHTYWYYYVSRADVQEHIDDPSALDANAYINANKVAYPRGFLGRIRIDTVGTPEIVNDQWLDQSGIDAFPFDDAGLQNDGETINYLADYGNPTCQKLNTGPAAGGYLVLFTKRFTGEADLAPTGDFIKVRAFIYNPISAEAKQYAFALGATYDTVSDTGAGSRYGISTNGAWVYYKETTGEIIHHRYADHNSAGVLHVMAKFGDFDISGAGDVAPAYIIFHILTNPVFRAFKYETTDIDVESYGQAIQRCYADDILVSTIWMREEDALKVIDLCLSLYGGYLTERDGKIFFGVAQFDAAPLAGRPINNDHLVQDDPENPKPPVRVMVGGKQDTFNKVKVNFLNRDLEYRQDYVEDNDEVDQDLTGIRAHEFPPQFTMSKQTATKIAARTLWSNLYNRPIFQFKLGWKDADLEPGTVVTLTDSFHPYLQTGKNVRLTHFKEERRGEFNWDAVEELPHFNTATLGVNSTTAPFSNPLFGPAEPPADFRMYELPAEFQGADALLYVGYNQLSAAMGARLYVSAQSTTGFARVDDVQPFIVSGRLAAPLPNAPELVENATVYLMPGSDFTVATPTYAQSFQLDDVDAAARGLAAGLIWVGSEMLAYESVTLLAQNHYRFAKLYRGWGGTNIHAHTSGDLWHRHGGGMFVYKYNTDKIGTTIYYKVSPYNFNGVEYDVSSIAPKEYRVQGVYYRPQNQGLLRTFIDTPITGTNSDNIGDLSLRGVTSGGTGFTLTWPDAARAAGYGAQGYGLGGYGRFLTDTTSHQWRVQVLSADGSVVRSTSVGTGFFVYSLAANSTDFNGWKGGISVRVTPYNAFGDAIRNQTKVLSLFF